MLDPSKGIRPCFSLTDFHGPTRSVCAADLDGVLWHLCAPFGFFLAAPVAPLSRHGGGNHWSIPLAGGDFSTCTTVGSLWRHLKSSTEIRLPHTFCAYVSSTSKQTRRGLLTCRWSSRSCSLCSISWPIPPCSGSTATLFLITSAMAHVCTATGNRELKSLSSATPSSRPSRLSLKTYRTISLPLIRRKNARTRKLNDNPPPSGRQIHPGLPADPPNPCAFNPARYGKEVQSVTCHAKMGALETLPSNLHTSAKVVRGMIKEETHRLWECGPVTFFPDFDTAFRPFLSTQVRRHRLASCSIVSSAKLSLTPHLHYLVAHTPCSSTANTSPSSSAHQYLHNSVTGNPGRF